jgi:hypothetical protein
LSVGPLAYGQNLMGVSIRYFFPKWSISSIDPKVIILPYLSTLTWLGHYAPVLVDKILKMNDQLAKSNPDGLAMIPIHSLGIGNGLTNPLVQYPAYITFAKSNPAEWLSAFPSFRAIIAYNIEHILYLVFFFMRLPDFNLLTIALTDLFQYLTGEQS